MSRDGSLWIGGLEEYMDEDFILKCLNAMGETYSGVISIKVVKNKFTGQHAGYGFINFVNDNFALTAMHKLNGKVMPNTNPQVRFKLNHNSTQKGGAEDNHSIWVGDLSPEVDDYQMYKFFSVRFPSVKSARVMLDENGFSKGFGFVRFSDQSEQMTSLQTMQGRVGLGERPMKVSIAYVKGKDGSISYPSTQPEDLPDASQGHNGQQGQAADYAAQWEQYNQYWSQYAAWQQYYAAQNQAAKPPATENPVDAAETSGKVVKEAVEQKEKGSNKQSIFEGNMKEVVQNNISDNIELLNQEYLEKSEELYTAIDDSRWWHDYD